MPSYRMIRGMSSASQQPVESSPPRRRDSTATSLAHYTPSVLFRNVVSILNTLIRPKLLNPQGFGLWSLLYVIPSYSCFLHLGALDYVRFAIPRLEAEGDEETIRHTRASVFWGFLTPTIGTAVALLILAAVSSFAMNLRLGLATMAVLVVLNGIYTHCVTLMKGHQMFRDLSRVIYLRNTVQLVLSVLLMFYMGIYGLFIALPVTLIIALLYLRTRYPVIRGGRFSWPMYFEMVRSGFPLMVFAFMMTLMITSGRLLVASYLTTEEVGYYALATLALRGMLNFPGAAREVIEPRIMEKVDTLHRADMLDRYLYRPLVINACYLPLIIAPLYFLLPPLLEWALPLYTQGILPLQIVLFGFYFLAVFYPMRGLIVAHRLQKVAALLSVLGVLINVGLSLLALELGFGIIGVSVANSVSYAALLLLMSALLRLRQKIRFPFGKIWPVVVAFPLLCATIWASRLWVEPWVGTSWRGAMAQSALLFGTGLALLTLAEYRVPLLKGLSPFSILRTLLRKPTK